MQKNRVPIDNVCPYMAQECTLPKEKGCPYAPPRDLLPKEWEKRAKAAGDGCRNAGLKLTNRGWINRFASLTNSEIEERNKQRDEVAAKAGETGG